MNGIMADLDSSGNVLHMKVVKQVDRMIKRGMDIQKNLLKSQNCVERIMDRAKKSDDHDYTPLQVIKEFSDDLIIMEKKLSLVGDDVSSLVETLGAEMEEKAAKKIKKVGEVEQLKDGSDVVATARPQLARIIKKLEGSVSSPPDKSKISMTINKLEISTSLIREIRTPLELEVWVPEWMMGRFMGSLDKIKPLEVIENRFEVEIQVCPKLGEGWYGERKLLVRSRSKQYGYPQLGLEAVKEYKMWREGDTLRVGSLVSTRYNGKIVTRPVIRRVAGKSIYVLLMQDGQEVAKSVKMITPLYKEEQEEFRLSCIKQDDRVH